MVRLSGAGAVRAVLRAGRTDPDSEARVLWWQSVFDSVVIQRGTPPSYPNTYRFHTRHHRMMNTILAAYDTMGEAFWLIDADDTSWPGHTAEQVRQLLECAQRESTVDLWSLSFYSGWQGHDWWTFGVCWCSTLRPRQQFGVFKPQWRGKVHPDCLFHLMGESGCASVGQWYPPQFTFRHHCPPRNYPPGGLYTPGDWRVGEGVKPIVIDRP